MTHKVTEADREAYIAISDIHKMYYITVRAGGWDNSNEIQVIAAHREASVAPLLALLEEAERALEQCADDLEAEIEARRGAVLERTMNRDLLTVREARTTLSKIQAQRDK